MRVKVTPCGVVKEAVACHRKALAAFRRFRSKAMGFALVVAWLAARLAPVAARPTARAAMRLPSIRTRRSGRRSGRSHREVALFDKPRREWMLAAVPPRTEGGESGRAQILADVAGRARGLSALLVRSLSCTVSEERVADFASRDSECKRSVRRRRVEWCARFSKPVQGGRQ